MHDGQLTIGVEQVAALIAEQLPELASEEIVEVVGAGTVNSIFRVGDETAARFPLVAGEPADVRDLLRQEIAAASEFLRACPVRAPEPRHLGDPGHGYPLPWTAQSWLPGRTATPTSHESSLVLADDLGRLVRHLRDRDPSGRSFEGHGRGGVLSDHDPWVEECIRRNAEEFDPDVMRTTWATFRRLPREDPDLMCHTDLIPPNLLVDERGLVGVLDTGSFRAADPALDLVGAWHLLADGPRDRLRTALDCSDLQWQRGKAWAFQQAVGLPWYYRETNPAMAEVGRTTLRRLLADR